MALEHGPPAVPGGRRSTSAAGGEGAVLKELPPEPRARGASPTAGEPTAAMPARLSSASPEAGAPTAAAAAGPSSTLPRMGELAAVVEREREELVRERGGRKATGRQEGGGGRREKK